MNPQRSEGGDLLAHRTIVLPGLLKLRTSNVTQRARYSNTAHKVRARNLLHETQTADLVLPVCDICNRHQ
jgi:hypothetical protein